MAVHGIGHQRMRRGHRASSHSVAKGSGESSELGSIEQAPVQTTPQPPSALISRNAGAHVRQRVGHAAGMRHLVEAVRRRHRADADRLEQDVVARISRHRMTLEQEWNADSSLIERSYNSNIDGVATLPPALHWALRSRVEGRNLDVSAETFSGDTMVDLKKYLAGVEVELHPLLRQLDALIRKAVPELSAGLKGGNLTYHHARNVCSLVIHRDHVNLQVWGGAGLPDPANLLIGTGKAMRHIRVASGRALNRRAIAGIVRAAAAAKPSAAPETRSGKEQICVDRCVYRRLRTQGSENPAQGARHRPHGCAGRARGHQLPHARFRVGRSSGLCRRVSETPGPIPAGERCRS